MKSFREVREANGLLVAVLHTVGMGPRAQMWPLGSIMFTGPAMAPSPVYCDPFWLCKKSFYGFRTYI